MAERSNRCQAWYLDEVHHKKPVLVEIVAKCVYEPIARPQHRVGTERWLIIERLSEGSFKYYVSSLLQERPKKIIRLAHQRYKVEQGY